jgi:macrolide-specific efflux system membrane fusion protein
MQAIITPIKTIFSGAWQWFTKRSLIGKMIIIACIGFLLWGGTKLTAKSSAGKTTYQTATAEKGTLVVSVSASGQVSSANNATVTTQTSGVVSKIFVQNGQAVKSGDPIAEVELDMEGKQRSAQAYASYLSAKNNLENANTAYYNLQSELLTNWKTYYDLAQNSTYTNPDGSPNTQQREQVSFMTTNNDWLTAEAKYKTQQNVVLQAQTALSSAWASYQQSSPTIYAPISGTLSGLSLQVGSVLNAQTSTSGSSTSQKIASIQTNANPMVVVNLSEIDVSKVTIGNKATVTLDAFAEKTFTGKIVSIDTTGTVSSGVTTYPAYIAFDTAVSGVLSNMGADAKIITSVKADIIMVPNAAVQTTDGAKSIRVMKNGTPTSVAVETGVSNDTSTEIVSGINEGDTVVTSVITPKTGTTTTTTTSPFSVFGGGGRTGGGGGAVIRTIGR